MSDLDHFLDYPTLPPPKGEQSPSAEDLELARLRARVAELERQVADRDLTLSNNAAFISRLVQQRDVARLALDEARRDIEHLRVELNRGAR